METQVKEKKDVNLEKIEDYLNKVSNHLYLTENKKFFKAFPVQVNGTQYFVRLEFNGEDSNYCWITKIDYYIDMYGNSAKNVVGDILFPPHDNRRTSIFNFDEMKEKVSEVKEYIEKNFNENNKETVQKEVKELLIGLLVKEKEKNE